jgi:A/G-specific adenine glycosylase
MTDNTYNSEMLKKIKFFRTNLLTWAENNFRNLPWRKTKDSYKVLIAEMMLHQTSVKKVLPVYMNFITKFPEITSLSKAEIKSIKKLIYPLGPRWPLQNPPLVAGSKSPT